MEPEGTKYLYHSDSKDIYRKAFKTTKCLHSRNIAAFLDRDESTPQMNVFMNHLEKCESCKKILDQTRNFYNKLDEFVPKYRIPRNVQLDCEREFESLLKNSKLKDNPVEKGKSVLKGIVETLRFTVLGR